MVSVGHSDVHLAKLYGGFKGYCPVKSSIKAGHSKWSALTALSGNRRVKCSAYRRLGER